MTGAQEMSILVLPPWKDNILGKWAHLSQMPKEPKCSFYDLWYVESDLCFVYLLFHPHQQSKACEIKDKVESWHKCKHSY